MNHKDYSEEDLAEMLKSVAAAEAAEIRAEQERMNQPGPGGPTGPTPMLDLESSKAKGAVVPDLHLGPDSGHAEEGILSSDASARSPVSTGRLPQETDVEATDVPEGYALFPDGIYELPQNEAEEPVFVCSPIKILARFNDMSGRGHGRLISVKAGPGQWHEIPIFSSQLLKRPADVVGNLVDHGLELATTKGAKDKLLSFLKASKPQAQRHTVSRSGWADDDHKSFVLGSTVVGDQPVLPLVQVATPGQGFSSTGDLAGWKRDLGAKCMGNPLMILATSVAFSGPLLSPFGFTSGGLHFRGASSSGKTTLLHLAASVWGSHKLMSQWLATKNGLEAVASTRNDILLPLDEIAEIPARDLHGAIYMLGNGSGKARMTKDTTLSEVSAWRLALISSGELSVREKLEEGRLDVMNGQEVRLIDIEADGRTFGAFDNLHGANDAAVFAENLKAAARAHHGTVGLEFTRRLISQFSRDNYDNFRVGLQRYARSFLKALPSIPDGQTFRVAERFALIGLAGEIATKFGLTGWQQRMALQVAERAFLDWYDQRYSDKHEAADEFVKRLQGHLAANLNAIPQIGAASVAGAMSGDWRDSSTAYLAPETWSQLFPGVEGTKAAKAILDLGMLQPGESGRLMRKGPRSIPGQRKRFYAVAVDRVMACRTE